MKKTVIFLAISFASMAFAKASAPQQVQSCDQKAIEAATIFQNQIVSEMIVDTASVTTAEPEGDILKYSVSTASKNGRHVYDTMVKMTADCSVKSVERE